MKEIFLSKYRDTHLEAWVHSDVYIKNCVFELLYLFVCIYYLEKANIFLFFPICEKVKIWAGGG